MFLWKTFCLLKSNRALKPFQIRNINIREGGEEVRFNYNYFHLKQSYLCCTPSLSGCQRPAHHMTQTNVEVSVREPEENWRRIFGRVVQTHWHYSIFINDVINRWRVIRVTNIRVTPALPTLVLMFVLIFYLVPPFVVFTFSLLDSSVQTCRAVLNSTAL